MEQDAPFVLTSDTNLTPVIQALCSPDEHGARRFELLGRVSNGSCSKATLEVVSGEVVVQLSVTCTFRKFSMEYWTHWVSAEDVSEVATDLHDLGTDAAAVVKSMRDNVPSLIEQARDAVGKNPRLLESEGLQAATADLITARRELEERRQSKLGKKLSGWDSYAYGGRVFFVEERFDRLRDVALRQGHMKDKLDELSKALLDRNVP